MTRPKGARHSFEGEFKVWALGNQKLQIQFSGTHEYQSHVAEDDDQCADYADKFANLPFVTIGGVF